MSKAWRDTIPGKPVQSTIRVPGSKASPTLSPSSLLEVKLLPNIAPLGPLETHETHSPDPNSSPDQHIHLSSSQSTPTSSPRSPTNSGRQQGKGNPDQTAQGPCPLHFLVATTARPIPDIQGHELHLHQPASTRQNWP